MSVLHLYGDSNHDAINYYKSRSRKMIEKLLRFPSYPHFEHHIASMSHFFRHRLQHHRVVRGSEVLSLFSLIALGTLAPEENRVRFFRGRYFFLDWRQYLLSCIAAFTSQAQDYLPSFTFEMGFAISNHNFTANNLLPFPIEYAQIEPAETR